MDHIKAIPQQNTTTQTCVVLVNHHTTLFANSAPTGMSVRNVTHSQISLISIVVPTMILESGRFVLVNALKVIRQYKMCARNVTHLVLHVNGDNLIAAPVATTMKAGCT